MTGPVPLTGTVQVGIKLQDPPLVVAVGVNAKQNGITMTPLSSAPTWRSSRKNRMP